MKDKLVVILVCIFVVALIINTYLLLTLQAKLSDCYFECNHLQTKLNQCEELSDYAIILPQILPPKAWKQLWAANEQAKQKRHWAYEGREMPLLTELEVKQDVVKKFR